MSLLRAYYEEQEQKNYSIPIIHKNTHNKIYRFVRDEKYGISKDGHIT